MENHMGFPRYKIACGYDQCRRVLKHVSKVKATTFFSVAYDNRKQVAGLIYTEKLVS